MLQLLVILLLCVAATNGSSQCPVTTGVKEVKATVHSHTAANSWKTFTTCVKIVQSHCWGTCCTKRGQQMKSSSSWLSFWDVCFQPAAPDKHWIRHYGEVYGESILNLLFTCQLLENIQTIYYGDWSISSSGCSYESLLVTWVNMIE